MRSKTISLKDNGSSNKKIYNTVIKCDSSNDPPDFKKYNFKLYIAMNETILWFKDMNSHEYHVTLKHNYVKGARGELFSLMILGLFFPLAIFTNLNRYGHGTAIELVYQLLF